MISHDAEFSNGSAATILQQATTMTEVPRKPYRPTPSMNDVRTAIERAMGDIVSEALSQAIDFVSLAKYYDKGADETHRYGHLVDAAECMEIAFTHLAMFKAAVNYSMTCREPDATTETRYWPTDEF